METALPPSLTPKQRRLKPLSLTQTSMSSYTFPIDTLFDQKRSSDLCFSEFFDSSHSSYVPRFDQISPKHEDDQTNYELSFETMFDSYEYRDESLADIVMGNNCNRGYEDMCHDSNLLFECRLLEPAFEAPIADQNVCSKSVSYNLRRACSTGDLLDFVPKHVLQSQKSFSEGLQPHLEETDTHRMRRYTAEQKRMSIDKYRAKRSLRNFNKTIKYECRKTLADNRPRIRGRFKRNEETSDAHKSCEDVIWMDRFHAMSCEENVIYKGHILNDYGLNQFEFSSSFS